MPRHQTDQERVGDRLKLYRLFGCFKPLDQCNYAKVLSKEGRTRMLHHATVEPMTPLIIPIKISLKHWFKLNTANIK